MHTMGVSPCLSAAVAFAAALKTLFEQYGGGAVHRGDSGDRL